MITSPMSDLQNVMSHPFDLSTGKDDHTTCFEAFHQASPPQSVLGCANTNRRLLRLQQVGMRDGERLSKVISSGRFLFALCLRRRSYRARRQTTYLESFERIRRSACLHPIASHQSNVDPRVLICACLGSVVWCCMIAALRLFLKEL